MKKLAALFATTIVSTAMLGGCDGSTAPETVTVHDTVTKIVYHNDPFAKSAALVHGKWQFVSGTDTAIATLFQDTTKVSASIQWKSGATWILASTKMTKDSMTLENATQKFYLWAKFTDSASHKITKMSGTYLDVSAPPTTGSLPAWEAKRTF